MATIQQGSAQNKLGKPDGIPGRSKFNLTKHNYTTQRYGQQQVIGVWNAITGDKWKIRCAHELKTYTLAAPLMTPMYIEKDFFQVPRCAILPLNWDKIYQLPNIGEDIDASEVGTSIKAEVWQGFLEQINHIITEDHDTWTDTATTTEGAWTAITEMLKMAIVEEYIYSYGSLINTMGCKMAAIWKQANKDTAKTDGYNVKTFDEAFENIWKEISYGFRVNWDEENPLDVDINLNEEVAGNRITLNEFLERARDDHNWTLTRFYIAAAGTYVDGTESDPTDVKRPMGNLQKAIYYTMNERTEYAEPVDMARWWSYQLVNAEYFTNDKVDYIYSAELFRQYVGGIVNKFYGFAQFEWNGIKYQYDNLSAKYFTEIAVNDWGETSTFNYLAALFSYKRSLKYLDYFTGSKTRPLAVGDVTVNTDAQGRVQVMDITHNIQKQRLLNAVNRIGRKAEDYAKEMLGVEMKWDYHTPLWLGSTRDVIRAEQTENTGEAQMTEAIAVTSKLYSYGGNYQFEVDIDRDSIILALSFYDLERSYARGVHRSYMHVDRMDMFNSYMQYTGDQALLAAEYDAALAAGGEEKTFGYVPAYEEFKQDYNEANGGFITALPGYTFIDGMERNNANFRPASINQSPDFIRCRPTELDRFYNSLTGHSLANYFHFIIDFYNEVECVRPMAFNPSIL